MRPHVPALLALLSLTLPILAACGSSTTSTGDAVTDTKELGPLPDAAAEAVDDAPLRDTAEEAPAADADVVPPDLPGDVATEDSPADLALDPAPDPALDPAPDLAPDLAPDPALDPAPELPPDTPPDDLVPEVPPDQRDPIFVEGCPVPGRAFARRTADPAFRVEGPDGIARPGDFLLANGRAAYVIEAAEHRNAYYLYGGILVDAVAVDGCRQAGPERFQELGLMMGRLQLDDFVQSVLRAFRADTVEIVADGSDGQAAIVRATGSDDLFWLVEDELIRTAYRGGAQRPLSSPLGLRVVVDYVLAPESNVLEVRVTFRNLVDAPSTVLAGCQTLFGLSTRITYYSSAQLTVGGFRLQTAVPWLAASAGDGAWAFAMDATSMATTNIHGVTALLDLGQVLGGPLELAAAGEDGDEVAVRYFVTTGPTDPNSAVRHLQAVNPTPMPDRPYALRPLFGTVRDRETGVPIPGATIDLEARNADLAWMVLDGFTSAADGSFGGQIADFGEGTPEVRLVVSVPGRPAPEPVAVTRDNPGPYDLLMEATGTVCVTVTDDQGQGLPARVLLGLGSTADIRIYPRGVPTCVPVTPGEYTATVTRGFEYTHWEGALTVLPNQQAQLVASLTRAMDTTDFLSVDTHCHAAPSPDNFIPIPERIATVAGEGLEVVVSTDHEAVVDWSPGVAATGLQDWVATVVGEEVTATMPEHMTMLGVEPRPEVDARGGIVRWYGLDMQQAFDALRDRGAQVVGLNHPRGWLRDIGYNLQTGVPALKDATRLGFPAGAQLFSFDMDMIELINGTSAVFNSGKGMFDYWTSFLNLGHRITAVGSSDAHDYDLPGVARTYFPSRTDQPAGFVQADLASALKEGRAVVSLGGFARVTINGEAGLGDTVTDTDGEVELAVHIEAMPGLDLAAFRVYVNCDQVLEVPATTPDGVVKFDGPVTVPVTADAHVIVMGFGREPFPGGFAWPWIPANAPRFVTNPIYVDVDGNGAFDPPGGKTCTYSEQLP